MRGRAVNGVSAARDGRHAVGGGRHSPPVSGRGQRRLAGGWRHRPQPRVRRRRRGRVRAVPRLQLARDLRHLGGGTPPVEGVVPDVNVGVGRQRRQPVDEDLAGEGALLHPRDRHEPLNVVARRGAGRRRRGPRPSARPRATPACTAAAAARATCGPLVITVRSESPEVTEIGDGTDSLTVMMFEQLLQRILSILPRTFSSAMEYLVVQRSQTNFIQSGGVRGSWGERLGWDCLDRSIDAFL